MTEGMSLAKWRAIGMLEREMALYVRLRPHLAGITIVSYGGREDDSVVAAFPGIDVVCNRWGLPQGIYRKRLSGMLRRACRGRAIYKSNQMRGAELALSLAQKAGASFIARCGYMLSEFVARAEGEASAEHRRATALENLVFNAAGPCIVTTGAMKEKVGGYGETEGRVSVIPNYVATDMFRPPAGQEGGKGRSDYTRKSG